MLEIWIMNSEPEIPADDAELPAPEKRDPESVVLRGRPSPVTRFKRGAIIGICALGSVATIGVTYVALQPAGLKLLTDAQDQVGLDRKRPPETLAGAPSTYADIPKLGPPLPGDLGRPILAAQRKMATEGEAPPTGVDQAAQTAEPERQRLLAEQRKVREAGVMMSLAQTPGAVGSAIAAGGDGAPATSTPPKSELVLDPERDPNAQTRKIAFAGGKNDDVINPHRIQNAISPYTLSAGSVIAGSLITGLNSDLPGFVTAQVTENVYDSPTGRILLLPQGSRLVGSYDSVVAFGQSRALLV
jgi:type IV secretion system protein TrbI